MLPGQKPLAGVARGAMSGARSSRSQLETRDGSKGPAPTPDSVSVPAAAPPPLEVLLNVQARAAPNSAREGKTNPPRILLLYSL